MLPSQLYELLPYLYFSVGLAAATNVGPDFGKLSGVLLAWIGFWIWRKRRENRRNEQ